MLQIREEITLVPEPSYLSMTTITSTFKISMNLDVKKLKQQMKDEPLTIKKKGSSKKGYTWNVKENKFFNQITAEYVDEFSKKSIKFFPNGSIHVTGCSDLIDCKRVSEQVRFCIKKYTGTEVQVSDFKILMINANFSMNSFLNLQQVSTKAENAGCTVSFKPEIYSAVKIKFVPGACMKKITASVFSSGCVLITGAKTLREITSSYKFLMNILSSTCVRPHPSPKHFNSFLAIPFESWKKHLLDIN
jgi:TATA-box binding protein (TBP) (component of TFIID and TFIIIB)